MPLTVAQLKELYQGQIAPDNNEEFLRILQDADLRLLETGKWMWCRARATLAPASGIITLDPEHASIIGACVEGYPTPIHMMDFEFSPDGPGEIDVLGGGNLKLIDQGINGSEERYYKVIGTIDDNVAIDAILHKAPAVLYDPDINDSDLPPEATINVICPDAAALKLTMMAILFEERHDLGSSRGYLGTAYARLTDREKTRRGNAQQVPNVRPQGRGVSRIRSFR